MQQPRTETEVLPPPPGIIASLRTGFDTITAHITAILMPLALDLLLWLGPRVKVDQLVNGMFKYLLAAGPSLGVLPDQLQQLQSSMTDSMATFQRLNVLALLRTFPIGIFSLMTGIQPIDSPFGAPMTFQVGSFFDLLLWIAVLTIIGWMFGGLYFQWIAALVRKDVSTQAGYALLQTLFFSLIWSVIFWTLGMPIFLILYVLFAINQLVGEGALLFLGFLAMWLIVPVFFAPHGMFLRKQNALISILSSFQLARFTLPNSSLFVMTVIMLGIGMNFLWSLPANNSWMSLVGILGHAFITTALLASSFVYYQDMTTWLQTVLGRLRASMPTQGT